MKQRILLRSLCKSSSLKITEEFAEKFVKIVFPKIVKSLPFYTYNSVGIYGYNTVLNTKYYETDWI